jgi:hypothetical protein
MKHIRTSFLAAVLTLCACGGKEPVGPPQSGGLNPCSSTSTPTVVTLPVGGVAVVSDGSAIGCTELQTKGGEAGTFLVVAANANSAPDSIPDLVLADSSAGGEVLANIAPLRSNQGALEAPSLQLEAKASVSAEARLRAMERRVLQLGQPPSLRRASALLRSTGTLGGVSAASVPSIGDTLDYKVPDPNATNACTDFTRVKAVVKAVGQHGILAQDVKAPAGGFTAPDFSAIAKEFDDIIYTTDTVHFGNPSDIDGNHHVVLLYTPVVNAATERGSQSVTQGFFFGGDLFPVSQCSQSNLAEVFYLIVPDPAGEFSDERSASDVREDTRGTIAHEFQHMINLSVRIREDAPDEDTWLNEGLSHFAEEIVGRAERNFTDKQELDIEDVADEPELKDFNAFFGQNLVRFRNWLRNPGELGATSTHADTSLAVRGASWALLRWSADHYAGSTLATFTRALVAGPQAGVENLSARAGVPFDSLMAGWMVANFADDGGVPGLASRYTYTSWNIRNVEAAVSQGSFPLVPTELSAGQSAPGSAPSAGGSYYLLNSSADGRTLIGALNPSGGSVTYTGARLYILRLQ